MPAAALVLLALFAGAVLSVQAAINSTLGRQLGRAEWAALTNFGVGLVALLLWIGAWTAAGKLAWPSRAAVAAAPPWAWLGGLLGAFYVSAVVVLAPRLGVAATLALSIAGQLAAALALDHYGLLGMATRPVTLTRVLGAALLVAAVLLMRR